MINKSKVLMFGWEFPPHNSGGLGTACLGLLTGLSEFQVPVTFVLPRHADVSFKDTRFVFADKEGSSITIRRINSRLSAYMTAEEYERQFRLYGKPDGIYGATLFEEVDLYARRAQAVTEKESFDVIHAHDWLSIPAGLMAKKISGRPLVVHIHATEFDRTGGNGVNQDVYEIERKGMEEADEVVAVSQFTKEQICRHYGISADKITVVHNGISVSEEVLQNLSNFSFRQKLEKEEPLFRLKYNGRKIILFLGRITLQKGPEYFLQTARKVLDSEKNVLFIFSGSGDMETRMMNQAASLGICDKVLFTGFLRGAELDHVYKAADLYVMPSVSEPFGITPLESIKNGTPVLISKQSGVSEVITNAFRADFWDIDEMTRIILAVIKDDRLGEKILKEAIKELPHISWTKAAQKCLGIYSRLAPLPYNTT